MNVLTRVCERCGAAIPPDSPQRSCGACLLEAALGAAEHEPDVNADPAPSPMLMDFGDYELLEQIGRGGQGVVFRARQKSLNRTVALKIIGLGQWATKAHLKRFRLEAEAAARLEHPGIVPIHEVGERDGSCYFSMKFVEGGQLDASPKREPMPIRQAVELIAKVARTVHYAHEHGILHRDIKPGNILLDAKGEPHLTDFGLARLVESDSSVTQTLDVLGTPSYMAPEQAVGNNAAVSSVTDVYGLGAVLYQLVTGQPPFAGGTTYETIKLLLDTEPRQPRLLNPKVDRDLSTICLKCLEKDPKRRYPSALALAEDLERWLKHEPIRARRSGFVTRARKWVRRNPTTGGILIAASLILIGVGMLALFLNAQAQEHKKTGRSFRERAKSVLANGTDNPIREVTALRNLALALNSNRQDVEAASMAGNLLLQHVWCPPAAPDVVYRKDALLAATFVPGGSNNEIFAVGADGQLLFWNGERSMSPTPHSLFEKPKPVNPQQIVQPGFASFSPDGRWLLIIPPTLASVADRESAVQGAPPQGALPAGATADHELCKIQIWRWSMQNRTYEPTGRGLGNSAASRFPHLRLCMVSRIRPCCSYQHALKRSRMCLFPAERRHFPTTP